MYDVFKKKKKRLISTKLLDDVKFLNVLYIDKVARNACICACVRKKVSRRNGLFLNFVSISL